jgi:stage V sporulation protein AE
MHYLLAFVAGGLICAVGQLLIDFTRLTPARILTGYVVAGVILGALGLYSPLKEKCGAGAAVPLTGFGSLIADGVKKAVEDQGALGILTGSLTAGAAGITAAIVFSLVASLFAKSTDKE